jgi:hypothetical protein
VFENRVLRRIFEAKKDEVIGKWRRLYNKESNDLYSSSNIIQMIKSRKMRWTCSTYGGGWKRRCAYRALVGNLRQKTTWKTLGIDGRIILKWIFKQQDWEE